MRCLLSELPELLLSVLVSPVSTCQIASLNLVPALFSCVPSFGIAKHIFVFCIRAKIRCKSVLPRRVRELGAGAESAAAVHEPGALMPILGLVFSRPRLVWPPATFALLFSFLSVDPCNVFFSRAVLILPG